MRFPADVLLVVATAASVLALWAVDASAQARGGLCPNPRNPACDSTTPGVGVRAGAERAGSTQSDTTPGMESQKTGPTSRCDYALLAPDVSQEFLLAESVNVPMEAVFVERRCADRTRIFWYVPGEQPPAEAMEVHQLAEEALGLVAPPVPRLVTSPPLGSEVLTGLPMYLAVDDVAFGELSGSVSAGQFRVTARVVPVSSWFSPGDGQGPVVCAGAGSVWSVGERPSEGDCTYTFTRTPVDVFGVGESFEVVGRVVYEASYSVEGPVLAGSYELGRLEGPDVVVDVPVIERRAVRTTVGG